MAQKNAPGLTTNELSELADRGRTTLLYWRNEHDLFSATEATQDNPNCWGKRYSLQDAQAVLTVCELQEQGLSLQKIRKAVEELRKQDVDLSEAVLRTDGENIYRVDTRKELAEQLTEEPGQIGHCHLIDLGEIHERATEYYDEHATKQDDSKKTTRDVGMTA